MRQLSTEDAAYLGGLIDGEGTISLTRRHAGERRQVVPYLRSYKRRRAQLVLERYLILTPRNGKYTDAASRARDAFERDFLQIHAR